MKFSVVIPVYNCADRLHVGVDSILGQTFTDFELILVNDGSRDDSFSVCRAYANRDSRVRVIDQENAGAGPARNRGISESRGEYLVFCDADDFYEPDSLAYFAAASEAMPDLIISSYQEFKYNKAGEVTVCGRQIMHPQSIRGQSAARAAYMEFRRQSVITAPWGKAYRRELVEEKQIQFADLRRCQDVAFNLYFYEHVQSVEVIPQVTYNYQTPDDDSYLKKFPVNMFEIHKTLYQLTCDSLKRWGQFSEDTRRYLDTHLQRDAIILLRLNYQNNWKLSRQERKTFAKAILNDPVLRESSVNPARGGMNRAIRAVLKSRSVCIANIFSVGTQMYQKINRGT